MRWPDVSEALGPVPWAVVGAVATRRSMPERGTAEMGVLVETADFAAAEARLAAAGWSRGGDLSVGGSTWRAPDGSAVVLRHTAALWCREALAEARGNLDDQGLRIIPLPYLVLLELSASRTVDIADVARMLGGADEAGLERVRALVAANAPEDLEDLNALVELGRLERADQA
jgi:hypothetical protein